MAKCSMLTKKKIPCPLYGDRVRAGVWFCHVHDPEGQAALNLKAKREEKKAQLILRPKTKRRPQGIKNTPDPEWLAVPPIKL